MRRGSARPATPWALTLILLAGLACWLIGERCARGATVDPPPPPPPPAAPAGIDWGEPNMPAPSRRPRGSSGPSAMRHSRSMESAPSRLRRRRGPKWQPDELLQVQGERDAAREAGAAEAL